MLADIVASFNNNQFYDLEVNQDEINKITNLKHLGYIVDCIGIQVDYYGDDRIAFIVSYNEISKEFYMFKEIDDQLKRRIKRI